MIKRETTDTPIFIFIFMDRRLDDNASKGEFLRGNQSPPYTYFDLIILPTGLRSQKKSKAECISIPWDEN